MACLLAGTAHAIGYEVHGVLGQGFVLSDGNNYFGDSTGGSFEYYEAGVNGFLRPLPELTIAAQVLARDAGSGDDGKLRLDFGFLDYAFAAGSAGNAGIRLGRVKNPYGFYNDSRDVVFTRPGILLPASVYYESEGAARSLLFASDGAQLYGGTSVGGHYLTLVGSYAPKQMMSSAQEERIAGDFSSQGDIHSHVFVFARAMDEWGGGRWSAALSFVHADLEFEGNPGAQVDFDLAFDIHLLSLRHNAERFALTTEYGITRTEGTFAFFGNTSAFDNTGDGIYLQADYFLDPRWTVMARYDGSFSNRNDRDGSECDTGMGSMNRFHCFAHGWAAGLNWKPDANWGAWVEYHWIDGASTVPEGDNEGRTVARRWSMILLMGAYRF